MTQLDSGFNIEVAEFRFATAARRGIAVTEFAMVIPVILLFMMLAYGMWRLTLTEHDALIFSQRATAQKASRFRTLGELQSPPDYVPDSRTPAAAAMPDLSGLERTLRAAERLPNYAAHAGGVEYLEQIAAISEEFGGFNLWRDGMVVRPSWTFVGYPMVNTQHPAEAEEVVTWYIAARDLTLTGERRSALGLSP